MKLSLRDHVTRAILTLIGALSLTLFAAEAAYAQVEIVVSPKGGVATVTQALGRAEADGIIAPRLRKRPPHAIANGRLGAYVVTLADSAALDALLIAWGGDPAFAYVQPNVRYQLDAAGFRELRDDDPLRDSLYHLDLVRAPEAWALSRGAGAIIGFVDSGVDLDHPDLIGQFAINAGEDVDGDGRVTAADFDGIDGDGNGFVDDVRGYDFLDRPDSYEPGDYRDRDPDPSDDNQLLLGRGHGTAVAGVLAAAEGNGEGVAGIAPDARLMPLRAFAADGRGDDDDIAAAIVYAADAGVDVLNLSFGTAYESALMREAVEYATRKGVVLVASAGNDGTEAAHYPSDFDAVISVVRLDTRGDGRSSLASHGQQVSLGAPGTAIYTTALPATGLGLGVGSEAMYRPVSGSSFAAPLVAGAAALVRSRSPQLSAEAVRSALLAGARDVHEPGWDDDTGAGLLDAFATLLRALPARTQLHAPANDAAFDPAAGGIPIRITALDPAFERFDLSVASGGTDVPASAFASLYEQTSAAFDAVAHTWDASALADGVYTLRLRVVLRTGGTIERRHRVVLDRTAPVLTVHGAAPALVGASPGIALDVATDDRARVCFDLAPRPPGFAPICSDANAGRHGLAWADPAGVGQSRTALVTATNGTGATTTTTIDLTPPSRTAGPLFIDERLAVPHGHLLPEVTDFDGDGLPELVLNEYDAATLGDTLGAWEWAGGDFVRSAALRANLLPRDAGDTDGDGREELLLQVKGATFLLEADEGAGFPSLIAYADSTITTADTTFLRGALLTDLDRDGRGELLGHDGETWVVLESQGQTYRRAAVLSNPTGVGQSQVARNEFGVPEALVHDLDGDGLMDLLVGDNDGDLIRYESRGDDTYAVVWTHETARYNAGALFATADLDGDGTDEVLTLTQNWPNPVDGSLAPAYGFYTVWRVDGDRLVALGSFIVASEPSRYTSAQGVQLDGGRNAFLLHHAPHVYTLHLGDDGHLQLGAYHGPEHGGPVYRGSDLVVHDFDADGASDVVLGATDGWLHRLRRDGFVDADEPPRWLASYALLDETDGPAPFTLVFAAPRSDSVDVLGARAGEPFDVVARIVAPSAEADTVQLAYVDARRFSLRAWFDGEATPLSASRLVRPEPVPVFVEAERLEPNGVVLRFNAPVDPARATFRYASREVVATSVEAGRGVFIRVESAGPDERIRWSGLRAATGAPMALGVAAVPDGMSTAPLVVASWTLDTPGIVRLRFSAPLDARARDAAWYALSPAGTISSVTWEAAQPSEVVVAFRGIAAGASGQNVTLTLASSFVGASDQPLAEDSRAILLAQPATDLDDVFAYPNPVHLAVRTDVTIGGVPTGATVRIVAVDGTLVRTLRELDRDGGVQWDLRDARNMRVPAGVYLLIATHDTAGQVVRKIALVP